MATGAELRLRFLVEVLECVRARVSDTLVVGGAVELVVDDTLGEIVVETIFVPLGVGTCELVMEVELVWL